MGQDIDTPRCIHCSDPLDDEDRSLTTGETFCGANPDGDQHMSDEEEAHARLMAGLRGIDLNDRYPRGDENGIIGHAPGDEPDEPLPRCTCPYWQDYHNDDCPHYVELLARQRRARGI